MKKVIAVILALVMAFSCSALCFADDETVAAAETTTSTGILATVQNILDQISSLLDANGVLAQVKSIIDQIQAFISSLTGSNAASVAGAIDDLEAKIADLPIVGDVLEYLHNLINTLKQKIKDLYAHDVETVAEEPVSTGSTSVGIVAFATVSVAAAAAYVCTKKKEN